MINCTLPLTTAVDGDSLTTLDALWQWICLAIPSLVAAAVLGLFIVARPPQFPLRSSTMHRVRRIGLGASGGLLVVGAGVLGAGGAGLASCADLIVGEMAYRGVFVGVLAGSGILALSHLLGRFPLVLSLVDVCLAIGVTVTDGLVRVRNLEAAAPLPAAQICLAGASVAAALMWSPLSTSLGGQRATARRGSAPGFTRDVARRSASFDGFVDRGRDRARIAHYSP